MDRPSLPDPDPVAVPVGTPAASLVPPRKHPWYSWRRLGYNFLTLSLLVHLLLGFGAAYLVVSVTHTKRKSFGGGPAPGGAQHAAEHKVSMAKTQQRSSAPAALQRVVTTGVSNVALPPMPVVAVDNGMVTPVSMSGMGGMGIGGLGGGGGGGSGGGGGAPSFFGVRTSSGTGTGLVGTFYDLKQNQTHLPTHMTPELYGARVTQFAQGGFNAGLLASYYKADKPIYATRIFTPVIPAELGPKAFGLGKEVQPTMWLVHYKGTVTVPESGTFRFVGMGDDVLLVKFNNQLVLDACWYFDTKRVQGQRRFPWAWSAPEKGATEGSPFTVKAGESYPMEVVIGEQPGGSSAAALLLQEDGKTYQKDAKGANILPFFRMTSDTNLPPAPPSAKRGGVGGYAPHTRDGPVWPSALPKAEPPSPTR